MTNIEGSQVPYAVVIRGEDAIRIVVSATGVVLDEFSVDTERAAVELYVRLVNVNAEDAVPFVLSPRS